MTDPCDMGVLLRGAVDAHIAANPGVTHGKIACAAGIAPESLSRALTRPNAAPALVRKVCGALGLRVALVPIA